MILISSWSRLSPILSSQVLSQEWRCSWSSADRRCSNYIWVVDNFIVYEGVPYIRDMTVVAHCINRIKQLGRRHEKVISSWSDIDFIHGRFYKNVISPFLIAWRYHSLALSHWCQFEHQWVSLNTKSACCWLPGWRDAPCTWGDPETVWK